MKNTHKVRIRVLCSKEHPTSLSSDSFQSICTLGSAGGWIQSWYLFDHALQLKKKHRLLSHFYLF